MFKLKTILGAMLALLSVVTSGPAAARWLSVDPVQANPNTGENFNRYYYANNNPYRFTDPDGRQALDQSHLYLAAYDACANTAGCTPDQVPQQIEDATAPYADAAIGFGVGGLASRAWSLIPRQSRQAEQSPSVGGVQIGRTPSEARVALEKAGYEGRRISNESGTESGTLHNVPKMKMDVRVMDGGPKHGPRVVTTRQGTNQPVNPANGRNLGNIPRGEQRTGSHIRFREKK